MHTSAASMPHALDRGWGSASGTQVAQRDRDAIVCRVVDADLHVDGGEGAVGELNTVEFRHRALNGESHVISLSDARRGLRLRAPPLGSRFGKV